MLQGRPSPWPCPPYHFIATCSSDHSIHALFVSGWVSSTAVICCQHVPLFLLSASNQTPSVNGDEFKGSELVEALSSGRFSMCAVITRV